MEGKASISARKAQKADREKLRRERLNEQFLELGNTVDPDRPKNDKVTMLVDTTQMLNDLTAEVNRLKAECSSLTEESCELTQEKKELREENAYLQGDITNLKIQYQQRLRFMFPWTGIDPSVVVAPPYLYPVPLSVPMGPVARRPSLQPYPFFGNHNAGVVDNPCSTFISYSTTAHPPMERALSSDVSFQRDCGSKSMDDERGSVGDKCDGSNDVVTELELKIPGSSTNQDLEAGEKKGKQTDKKERSLVNHLSSRQYNSSQGSQDNASNNIDEISKCSK
ncbi:naringenin,2-oxoglutarate 3-dioxygenase-like [Hibiscus syriacus]|uniref:Naringenin,2-oxoglutarate 3-dioxygenase-like n=2 Tax=Hibiscus syriacus TaxID=106335 RepID=A0A6A2ZT94_HIBSY|nr:naringenin,2-oxoglutarate 3-dioxygenase-like [Hibiscus syriacus]